MKSIKMFGKSVPLLAIVMVSLLAIGASAYLVDYLSNTVTSTVAVTSPMEVGLSLGRGSWATAQTYRPPSDGTGNPGGEVPDWAYCSCDAGDPWHVPVHITEAESDAAGEGHEWFTSGGRAADAPYIGGMVDAFPEGVEADGTTPIHDWNADDWTKTGILVIPDIKGGETITLYFMSASLADASIKAHEEIRVSNPGGITVDDFVNVTTRFDGIYGDNGYSREYIDNLGEEDVWQVTPWCIEMWSDDNTSTWNEGETDVARWKITFNEAAFGTYTFTYRITPAVP